MQRTQKLSLSFCLFCGLTAFSLFHSITAEAQDVKQKVEQRILQDWKDTTGPGGAFLIAHRGKVIFKKAYGKANLELNVDLTTENVFQLGSLTKQFTAIAILMLEENGQLKLNDPLSKYLPQFPNGEAITLHHLLTHTSGIKDYTKMKELGDIAQKDMTPLALIDFFKNEAPVFKPGEKFEYNNSGYFILGYIIELVSGMPYQDFIRNHIFLKLGMKNSFYSSDRTIVQNRADGYQKKGDQLVNKTIISYSIPYAAGALMSTLQDLLLWQEGLSTHKLLKKENQQKAFEPKTLSNGDTLTYGYGWHIRSYNGVLVREHGGSVFGFKSMAVYIPSMDIYAIGLTNCDCFSPTQLVRDLALLTAREFSASP